MNQLCLTPTQVELPMALSGTKPREDKIWEYMGGDYSQTLSMNNKGQVVGTSFTLGGTDSHAFLWQNGKMTDGMLAILRI